MASETLTGDRAGGALVATCRLSYEQRRMWLQAQTTGGHTDNVVCAWELVGDLDHGALLRAFEIVVDRHGALRTSVVVRDGEPEQRVHAGARVEIPVIEVRSDGPENDQDLATLVQDTCDAPFDLAATPPLLRARLFSLGAKRFVLAVAYAHIVVDDASVEILRRELATAYAALIAGAQPDLPPLAAQYHEHAVTQQAASRNLITEGLRYWRGQLAGAMPGLELPTDAPRPPTQLLPMDRVVFTLDEALSQAIQRLAIELRGTPFLVHLAAFQILLSGWAGDDDVVVCAPMANRPGSAFDGVVGYFANTVPLRSHVSPGDSSQAFLQQVRTTVLNAMRHCETPFEDILAALAIPRTASAVPFTRAFISLNAASTDTEDCGLAGLETRPWTVPPGPLRQELTLVLTPTRTWTRAQLLYAENLFQREKIERFASQYVELLGRLTTSPAASLRELRRHRTDAREFEHLVAGPRCGPESCPCLLEQVLEVATEDPQTLAIDAANVQATFGELAARARSIAARLHRSALSEEALVGVLAPGGPDQIAGALGAWLAGAAFVMLDPVNPEHSAAACAAARPSVVLAAHELVDAAHDVCGAPVLNMDSIADQGVLAPEPIPDGRLAYVGLTSDSTGKPRPVAVQHGGLRSLCAATRDLLGAQGAALCAMSPTLDGYVWFTLAPLALGRTVLIRDGSEPAVGESDVRPTTSLSTPAQLVAGGDTLDEVPTVIVQGEPVSASLTRGWSPARRLVNAYGATEVTCVCAWTDWKRDDSTATLGRPIINSRVYVLDQDLDPVGPGVTGEIYVAGPGVARGYPGEAGLTASRFVPDPFGAPGSRMYRTGDQARWNAHGFLEFIGRLQDEVTIRGFRLNLAAVERAALELAEVRSAAAMTDERGDILGLALVPAPGASPTPEKIRAELGARRADYTVPTAVEILDEMPLDSNGKIDRLVLREVLADTRVQAAPGREPQTDVERQIAAVWSSVLGATVDDVELTFFEAGGRSLLVGRLVRLLRETIDAPFTLAAILDDPTIRGLAEFVEANL